MFYKILVTAMVTATALAMPSITDMPEDKPSPIVDVCMEIADIHSDDLIFAMGYMEQYAVNDTESIHTLFNICGYETIAHHFRDYVESVGGLEKIQQFYSPYFEYRNLKVAIDRVESDMPVDLRPVNSRETIDEKKLVVMKTHLEFLEHLLRLRGFKL